MGPSQAPPTTPPPSDSAQIIVRLLLLSSCFSIMNVSVALGPCAAVGYLPLRRGIGEGAESFEGGLPLASPMWGLGPAPPLPCSPAGLEPAGLD